MSRGGIVNRSWSSTATSARIPGSSRPATSSSWFTHATPEVKASIAASTVTGEFSRYSVIPVVTRPPGCAVLVL